jgi:transcriptional regulator with XRE-family HTH domain
MQVMAVKSVYKKSDSVHFCEHDINVDQKVKPLAFGERLRIERERLGLSQLSFAELGGVKRTTQHLYETGVRAPDMHYLERIKNSGVDLAYLVLGERLPIDNGLNLSHSTLTALYKLVDEFCVTSDGVLSPLDTRLRFFQMLCAAVGHLRGEDADIDTLRAEMSRFRSV